MINLLSARVSVRFVAGLTYFLGMHFAYAQTPEDGWQLLQKAAAAAHVLSYQGIFVCETGHHNKAVQMTHLYNGQGEYSRNVTLDNTPREVFSQGRDLIIYNPKKEKIIIEKRRGQNLFPAILPLKLDGLKDSYTLRIGDTDKVAGRSATLIWLTPKDNLRYTYQFWIDQEYGLLLKYSMLNGKQEPLETIGFNQLNLMKTLDLDWFQPQIDAKKNYVMEESTPAVADSSVSEDWSIQRLPAGFVKIDQMKLMAHGKTTPVTQLIFSDGLASISLFIEPLMKNAQARIGHNSVGNNSFYANVQKGYQITVVGEVPQETVAKIGDAVVFKK
jgi:sigma-E factor negative regulatory protein RseB